MHPILLKLGPFTVYSYGVMVALGFAVATLLIYRRSPKFGIDPEKVIDIAIAMIVSGIIGARLLYIILNLNFYLTDPIEIFKLSNGGLVWYGGFLSALVTVIIYTNKKGLGFWKVADLVAPYIALAQAFGRIGCYLNGCCYGIGPADRRFPVQLVSCAVLFAIYMVLKRWQDKKHYTGEIFLAYCILYSLKRFFMEFLRADNPKLLFSLTLSQAISVIIVVAASVLFIYKALRWKKINSDSR